MLSEYSRLIKEESKSLKTYSFASLDFAFLFLSFVPSFD
jgi:hypothetical protein